MRTHTYTYAVMHVSRAVYDEVAGKLREAGYGHAFHEDREDGTVLDMNGIALAVEPEEPERNP